MARDDENQGFACLNCGRKIKALTNGSYRNHCPACLYSLHVDIKPGDRAQSCGGLMMPVGLAYKPKKGWQIIHRCQRCGGRSRNKVALDSQQPDNLDLLARL